MLLYLILIFEYNDKKQTVQLYSKKYTIILTGKVPGIAASKNATSEFVGAPYLVSAPENNLETEFICACTSNPTTPIHRSLITGIIYRLIN